ncbi:MAG: hypothetical protein ACOYOJ_05970 [Alsobacter sp.]
MTTDPPPRILPCGDSAVTVEFGNIVDAVLNDRQYGGDLQGRWRTRPDACQQHHGQGHPRGASQRGDCDREDLSDDIEGHAEFADLLAIRVRYLTRHPDGSASSAVETIEFRKAPDGHFNLHLT